METPRPWQFSLSNWSVTRKVGIVLVLPVVLATLFAVLRINNGCAPWNNSTPRPSSPASSGP